MDSSKEILNLSNMFSVLGEQSRLAIVIYLMNKEASVSEIVNQLLMSQSAVSHQLRILREAKVVKAEKQGKMVFYSIKDEHVRTIVNTGLVHTCCEEE